MLKLVFLFPTTPQNFFFLSMGKIFIWVSLIICSSRIYLVKKEKKFIDFSNSITNRKIIPCNWYLTCSCYYLLIFAIRSTSDYGLGVIVSLSSWQLVHNVLMGCLSNNPLSTLVFLFKLPLLDHVFICDVQHLGH